MTDWDEVRRQREADEQEVAARALRDRRRGTLWLALIVVALVAAVILANLNRGPVTETPVNCPNVEGC